jgi:hypothetical protein
MAFDAAHRGFHPWLPRRRFSFVGCFLEAFRYSELGARWLWALIIGNSPLSETPIFLSRTRPLCQSA